MNTAIGALLFAIVLLGAITCRAKPAYYDEQLLNYRLTEFCATVKPPPRDLIEAIDNAFKQDQQSLIAAWQWIHDLDQKVRARCGDA
jgi:hypothetical protein